MRGAHGEQGWVTRSISGVSVPSEYPHRSHKKPKGSCLVFYKVGSLPPYCPVRVPTVSERVRHSIPARFRYGVFAQVVPGRTGSFKSTRAGTFIRADITNGFFPEIAGIPLLDGPAIAPLIYTPVRQLAVLGPQPQNHRHPAGRNMATVTPLALPGW